MINNILHWFIFLIVIVLVVLIFFIAYKLAEKDELYDELSRSAALGLDKKDAEIERLKKEIEELKAMTD